MLHYSNVVTSFLWKCLHPQLNTCIDKYMLLTYYITSQHTPHHVSVILYTVATGGHTFHTNLSCDRAPLSVIGIRLPLQADTYIATLNPTQYSNGSGHNYVYMQTPWQYESLLCSVRCLCTRLFIRTVYTCTIQHINCLAFLI